MSRLLQLITAGLLLALVASCAPSKFKSYSGPPVTQIVVNKSARQMLFLSGNTVIKSYNVGLGNEPRGHKQFSGDGKTPEGLYYIDRRNPDSRYHLSIGISYPNPVDSAYAAALGQQAGGDIFIHGRGPEGGRRHHGRGDASRPGAGGDRGGEEQTHDEERADRLVRRDDGDRHEERGDEVPERLAGAVGG